MTKTQIGWYTVKEAQVKHKTDFSYAAWWEDVELKPGKYPVYLYDMRVYDDGKVEAQGAYTSIGATTIADYFASHFCGMPISDYDTRKNAGHDSDYRVFDYLYEVAEEVLGGDSAYELLPGFEAKEYTFMYDDEVHTTHGFFKLA